MSELPASPDSNQDGTTARRRVWIVDDSALELEMARRALAHDYDVRLFTDGTTVLEHITSSASSASPDVLVCDWVMPGISGIEVCQFLRGRPESVELPILLLTMN